MDEQSALAALGQIKQVKTDNLRSGDKRVILVIEVVGAEVSEATKFSNLPIGATVVLAHRPDLKFDV